MNNNRFKNGNICQNCGASIPYGSFICRNCHSPLRLEQVSNNKNINYKKVSSRNNSNLLVPTLLIISIILVIITVAVIIYTR